MTKNHDETSSESWHIVTDSPGNPRMLMQCLSEDCKAEVRGWFWISYLSYNDIMPSESDQDCHLISRYEWLIPVVAGRRVLLPQSVGECKSSEALMSRSRPMDSGLLTLFMLASWTSWYWSSQVVWLAELLSPHSIYDRPWTYDQCPPAEFQENCWCSSAHVSCKPLIKKDLISGSLLLKIEVKMVSRIFLSRPC